MGRRVITAMSGTVAATAVILALATVPAAARPLHWVAPGHYASPPTTAQCLQFDHIACYSPNQYQVAYNMNPLYSSGLTGTGQTIVLVDSWGSPTIASDLRTFDQGFGLPDPPSFNIITPEGPSPTWNPNRKDAVNWAIETSLDVEYAHSMAPGANILLVETPVDETEGVTGLPQMMSAESYVINHHLGQVISQSFGATEETFPSAQSILNLRYAFQNAQSHHVTVLGASGDGGATDYESNLIDFYPTQVNSWPSTDPLVTSVGGTQLHLDANGNRTAPDNVWNDTALFGSPAASGGGLSSVFSRPAFQNGVAGVVGDSRGTPDISMSAAVDGGALVYMGVPGVGAGYYIVGGTSEASPLFSGIAAIADQAAGHMLGQLNPAVYAIGMAKRNGIVDVKKGTNTVTFPQDGQTITVQGFDATPGYDLSSGWGTANGQKLVSDLAGTGALTKK